MGGYTRMSNGLGLDSRVNKITLFNKVFEKWQTINGVTLTPDSLTEINPSFKGLPVILRIPVITVANNEDGEKEIRLTMTPTEWYAMLSPNPNHSGIHSEIKNTGILVKYLISPQGGDWKKCWIIANRTPAKITAVFSGWDYPTEDLTLWQGSANKRMGTVFPETAMFTLYQCTDVEQLLHCYMQLQEVNKIQVFEAKRS